MNNFAVIQLIDDVLFRLHAVAPEWKHRLDGPRQWLYLAEPKISHEIELVRLTTVLSEPSFPPSEERLRDGSYRLSDGTISKEIPPPRLASGSPLPKPRLGQVSYSVDFHLVQAFSGLRAVLLVLIDSCATCALDADFIGRQPYTDSTTVLKAMGSWSESDFVPNAKYWKDWPLARFLRNEFPPVPPSWTLGRTAPLFSGETGRYVLRLATYPGDRDDSFHYYRAVFGLAQSKRGFAEVPRSFVHRSMVKHAAQLSTPPKSEPDLDAAKVFAQTFFKGFRCPKIFANLSSIEGSTKASVENPRFGGGAREFLRRVIADFQGLGVNDEPLVRMFTENASEVFQERGLPPLSPQDWQLLVEKFGPEESRSYLPLGTQLKLDVLIIRNVGSEDLPVARVAEVLEPLKVRLITAMSAVRSHVARPLQGALWRYLRSSPVFQLIGEPVSESIIHGLVERHRAAGGGEDPFVSGDYSAATDGLDIRVSKVFLEEALNHLDPEDMPYRAEIASVLYEQIIVYPPWTRIDPIIQRNGQLMGSVLSFPILCLANLFAYIQSLPDSAAVLASKARMDQLPVLINGDDILFRSPDSHYSKWLLEIGKVGFSPSVGKNFRHARFFTVNSVPIEYRPAPTPFQFWSGQSWADMEESPIPWDISQVPTISIRGFLNVGLLTGQAKLTGRESLGALPLSGWHAGAVLEALNPSQAHKWFLKYHRREIQSQTRFGSVTLNIFAHPLLGGLGFQVPEGVDPRFSPEQRRIAHSLFLSASYTYEAQESEYRLDSLLFLESDLEMPLSSLGRKARRVEVQLYPVGTPLPEGYEPFRDETNVQPLAMVHAMPPQDEDTAGLKARCRLSSSRLRQLTKRFGTDLVDLHPVDKMTEFPYFPVRVSRSTFIPKEGQNPNNASLFVERPYSHVYSPNVPHQDVSCPLPEGDLTFFDVDSSEPEISLGFIQELSHYLHARVESEYLREVHSVVEDWETASTTLVAPVARPAPSIRSHAGRDRARADRTRNAANQGLVLRQ